MNFKEWLLIENAEFLKSFLENPRDATPLLVYADWLEEHGWNYLPDYIRKKTNNIPVESRDVLTHINQELKKHGLEMVDKGGVRTIAKVGRMRKERPLTFRLGINGVEVLVGKLVWEPIKDYPDKIIPALVYLAANYVNKPYSYTTYMLSHLSEELTDIRKHAFQRGWDSHSQVSESWRYSLDVVLNKVKNLVDRAKKENWSINGFGNLYEHLDKLLPILSAGDNEWWRGHAREVERIRDEILELAQERNQPVHDPYNRWQERNYGSGDSLVEPLVAVYNHPFDQNRLRTLLTALRSSGLRHSAALVERIGEQLNIANWIYTISTNDPHQIPFDFRDIRRAAWDSLGGYNVGYVSWGHSCVDIFNMEQHIRICSSEHNEIVSVNYGQRHRQFSNHLDNGEALTYLRSLGNEFLDVGVLLILENKVVRSWQVNGTFYGMLRHLTRSQRQQLIQQYPEIEQILSR